MKLNQKLTDMLAKQKKYNVEEMIAEHQEILEKMKIGAKPTKKFENLKLDPKSKLKKDGNTEQQIKMMMSTPKMRLQMNRERASNMHYIGLVNQYLNEH